MKTPYLLLPLIAVASMLSGSFISAYADNTIVEVPGVHISTGDGGTSVIVPGVQVQTPQQPSTNPIAATPPNAAAAQMPAASYSNAQLPGMDFSNRNLAGVSFTNAVLTGSSFRNAILTGADFTNADLSDADLSSANLTGASLTNVILSGANLTNADLSRANLTNATIDQALAVNTRFDGAILTNVNMGLLIRQAPARPAFIDAGAIATALRIDPVHPNVPRKIDLTVNFDFNSDKLTVDGAKQVHEIAGALAAGSLNKSHIVVQGHTDNIGSDKYNQDLSYRRAKRVMQTLIEEYNVQPAMLSAKGFGKTQPIASNDSDIGRAMNRRVTLVNLGETN